MSAKRIYSYNNLCVSIRDFCSSSTIKCHAGKDNIRLLSGIVPAGIFPYLCPIPLKNKIDGIERIALSIELSITIVVIIGLLLNYTPWGIRLGPILLAISSFTLVLGAARRETTVTEYKSIPVDRSTFNFLLLILLYGFLSHLYFSLRYSGLIKVGKVTALILIVLLLINSLVKSTCGPSVSNRWMFYSKEEKIAMNWMESNLERTTMWAGFNDVSVLPSTIILVLTLCRKYALPIQKMEDIILCLTLYEKERIDVGILFPM